MGRYACLPLLWIKGSSINEPESVRQGSSHLESTIWYYCVPILHFSAASVVNVSLVPSDSAVNR